MGSPAPAQAVAGLDAIGAAITAGASPPSGLSTDRFYRDGEVPPNAPLDYFLLGQVVEDPAGFYNAPGNEAVYWVHCWADTYTQALRMWVWLFALLHDQMLTLDDLSVWQCKVSLVGKGADATSTAQQATVNITMRCLAAA